MKSGEARGRTFAGFFAHLSDFRIDNPWCRKYGIFVHPRIVIDTSVLIAGLRNRLGPSQRLLRLVGEGEFETALSVPLFLEYQEVSKRLVEDLDYTEEEIDIVLDYLCRSMNHYKIDFLWRPFLHDGDDDMVLELAVASSSQRIVTYNIRDFQGCEQFGITAVTPEQFLAFLRRPI